MQITIQLDDKARRPIANLSWFNGCRALIDTGALFPIWNRSEDKQPVRILRLSDDDDSLSVYLAGTYKTDNEYFQKNRKLNI